MTKKILTVRNFLLSFSLLLLLFPTIVYATELEGGTVYEEIQEESIEEVENSESEVVNKETQSEEPTQEETTEETQSEELIQEETTEETQSVVIYETPTNESTNKIETSEYEETLGETETSEPTEENTQPIRISIQTDNAEIIENTDEEGNIIGYTVSSNEITSEPIEIDLTRVETLLENTCEQLQEVTLILYVIAMLLGGFLIYVLLHWSLSKKGVLE